MTIPGGEHDVTNGEEYPVILGVYSLQTAGGLGVGGTASKHAQITYWYARRLSQAVYEVQPLNAHHVPSGLRKELPEIEFLTSYVPEPTYYRTNTVPALQTLARKIAEGERLFSLNQLDAAEKQFLKALMIDGLNVRANYGLGEVYSEKKDFVKLKKVLDTLLGIDEAFHQEQRERFNSFGINLRKNGHFEESLRFYQRALEFNDRDENVFFNIARVYFDKGDTDTCRAHLRRALDLNPEFLEARKFLKYCDQHGAVRTA